MDDFHRDYAVFRLLLNLCKEVADCTAGGVTLSTATCVALGATTATTATNGQLDARTRGCERGEGPMATQIVEPHAQSSGESLGDARILTLINCDVHPYINNTVS